MSSHFYLLRRARFSSHLKPCSTIPILSQVVKKGFPSVVSSRHIASHQELGNIRNTPWKPLSDPEANKRTLIRLCGLAVIVVVGAAPILGFIYSMHFSNPNYPQPKRN